MDTPTTFLEAVTAFADPERAQQYFANLRWPNGVACPREGCGNADVRYIGGKRPRWLCKECKREFTAKVGTVFEDSPVGFDKWLPAIWMLTNDRNGVSSYEVHRALGVTQKTAWFMLHRIRLAMQSKTWEALTGEVEADETLVGGKVNISKAARRHRRAGGKWDRNFGKTRVLGLVQRGGEARAWSIPNTSAATMLPKLVKSIRPDATLMTDGSWSFWAIGKRFAAHEWINHAIEYVRGNVHTNNIEGFWSVLKRTIGGTYIHVNPRHLDRYLAEQVFRFNASGNPDGRRFVAAARGADQKRLTYRELIARS
ncbi:MAG TPA: IS1595 family transposase [Candidatus Dormibacteraeota bacterium]|nr:IS1595 family transposase [Candidatus Dormibacteraeota bacterium]